MKASFGIQDGSLWHGKSEVLSGVPDTVELRDDRTGGGAFLHVRTKLTAVFWRSELGQPHSVERFTVCHRKMDPFWMVGGAGGPEDDVPPDTQWLLVRRTDGLLVLIVPILDSPLRFSLDGRGGTLAVWGDTGDAETVCQEGTAVFIATGDDIYELQARGARAVIAKLGTATPRTAKPLPDFADLFGWCTWDAFYQDVSVDKVRRGLAAFRDGGVVPGFLLLDDGWHSEQTMPNGGRRLTSFHATPDKFPGGLRVLKRMMVEEFGMKKLIVWHAIMGYWAGVDVEAFSGYDVVDHVRVTLPAFGKDGDMLFGWYGLTCGQIPTDRIFEFFDNFHAALEAEGVDGVKVDNQSSLEYSGTGQGGRMELTRAYRQGLEASCEKHFNGRLINCMANANETYYMAGHSSGLMRTSEDFWPGIPASHGKHLYTNALVSVWFGEFMHPDWDMFQSEHEWGGFHAAARAISGSPVYVSDKVDEHNFDLLRQLVCSDGGVPRCLDIARLSPDCIFHDPTREPVALKLFNRNRHGWVLGVFNARYDETCPAVVEACASPTDVPGMPAGSYAVYAYRTARLCPCFMQGETLILSQGEWEIFWIAPFLDGVAILGLTGKFNGGGCLASFRHAGGKQTVSLLDTGDLLVAVRDGTLVASVGSGDPQHLSPDADGLCRVYVTELGTEISLWIEHGEQ